jgi:nickel-dependent lactate racemase
VIVKLPFGDEHVPLDLRGFRVRALAPSAPPGRDPSKLAETALENPVFGPPLAEIGRGRKTATVIVPDATRKTDLPSVLPILIEHLTRAGIEDRSITVLVANGTHPPVGPESLTELLGPLSPSIRIAQHESRATNLVTVGEIRPGLPLRLHPSAVETDFLVTVGAVRHHYFAGFGGGPKMVFPGVSGHTEIQANHALVLDPGTDGAARHPGCEPGVLVGNPVAEEIRRGVSLRSPEFALCLVEGRDGGIAWAGAGPWQQAFEAAVDRVRTWFQVPLGRRYNLMVASSGGAPTDDTLIQAHKSLDAACRFLEPGGEMLWVASLAGGLGSPAMAPFVENPTPARILEKLSREWVQYGHTTLRIVEKSSRYRVRLCSNIDSDVALRLGFEPIQDPDSVIEEWRERHQGESVAVMASGAVYPRPRGA